MAVDVLAYISGEEGRFQMVGDYSLLFVDAVSTEVGVIPQDSLGSVRSTFGCGRSLAFLPNHCDGTIAAGELCRDMARLIVNQNAERDGR